jgi:hypothetical protein
MPPQLELAMSEKLRRQMIEQHGHALGPVLFEAELSRRTRINEQARTLNAELADLRAEYDAQSTELPQNLPPLQAAMEAAYQKWLAACNVLEPQRIQNQAATSSLQARISELTTRIQTPTRHVTQWDVPDWYRPTQEIPPMPQR